MNRYHIQRGEIRTTVTLDSTICELLALKLGVSPDAKGSHKMVRHWLQLTSEQTDEEKTTNLSQWLKQMAILHIADRGLITKHHEWKDEVDQHWDEELATRINDLDSGKIKMLPKGQVFSKAREQIS